MGGKSKKTSSNTQSLDSASQRNVTQGQANIRNLMRSNPFQAYEGEMVAGINDTQNQARSLFEGGMNQGNGLIDQAASAAQAAGGYSPEKVQAQNFSDADLSRYTNPFQQQVIDAAGTDINRQRELSLNDNKARAARAGAFGGSRHGVVDAETNRAAGDTYARTVAGLRSDGFNQAASLFNQDANRRLQADQFNVNSGLQGQGLNLQGASLLGELGQYQNDNNRNNAQLLNLFGTQEQDTQTAINQASYQEALRERDDVFRRVGVEGMITGLMPNLVNSTGTSTQRQSPGIGQIVGTGLQAASLFSDRRLKSDITPVGTHKGRKWYEYRYLWDNASVRRLGVMAQDLLKTEPERVILDSSGFYKVDYRGIV